MIVTRAPLRISFVGGGTDIETFYKKYKGRVLSVTIDKFVYVVSNKNEFRDDYVVKYSETEVVKDINFIKHDRFREAIKYFNIPPGIEISSFADLPSKTGLGSSSSFSVALMKTLSNLSGKKVSKTEAANLAVNLEIDLLKEPIGKQDQYAASFGGFNIFEFNADGSVDVLPIHLDFTSKSKLEDNLLLFYTGITRSASSVLGDQKEKIEQNFETYKKMSDSVLDFKEKLLNCDIEGMAKDLDLAWERKRSLSKLITNSETDELYLAAKNSGAMGGKILGAGGGGCLLFFVKPESRDKVLVSLRNKANELGLSDAKEISFRFTQGGVDTLFNS